MKKGRNAKKGEKSIVCFQKNLLDLKALHATHAGRILAMYRLNVRLQFFLGYTVSLKFCFVILLDNPNDSPAYAPAF